jgi:hypothetical protein
VEKVQASLEKGVLEVVVPKKPEAEAKKVAVSSKYTGFAGRAGRPPSVPRARPGPPSRRGGPRAAG